MSKIFYPDTNIYFRPFDKAKNTRVILEAEFCLLFWREVRQGNASTVLSPMIKHEMSQAPDEEVDLVLEYLNLAGETIEKSNEILTLGQEIEQSLGVPGIDSLHIAFASHSSARILLTCDDDMLNKDSAIEDYLAERNTQIEVQNPLNLNYLI